MKYEFVPGDEIVIAPGRTVKRIRALIAIAALGIAPGDLGGYVESAKNLEQVYGDARVYGDAWVESQESICSFSGFGSEFRTTTAFVDKELGVRIVCGCFSGTLYQFREKVIKTHGEDSKNGKLYLGMANMIELRLGVPQ